MKKLLFGVVAMWSFWAVFPAYAAPTCTTTTTVTSTTPIAGSVLLGSGNCFLAGDKIFGNFSVSGAVTGAGSGTFTFTSPTADVTLGFQGTSVTAGLTGGLSYEVMIDAALAAGEEIHNLQKDFTFNAAMPGTATGTSVLKGTTSVAASSFQGGDITTGFQCSRSLAANGTNTTTCPQTGFFSPLISDLVVGETITAGSNATVTALTDTISQAVPGVPEPSSMAMLGSGLLLLGMVARRRRS